MAELALAVAGPPGSLPCASAAVRDRRRAAGAARRQELVFTDRVPGHPRGAAAADPARGAGRAVSTWTAPLSPRAIREVRPAARRAGIRRPRQPWSASPHPGRPFRLRRTPKASASDWTAVKSRSAARVLAAPDVRRSCPGKKKQNTIKFTNSATTRAAPCSPASSARAACTTRPRCVPRASTNTAASIPTCAPRSTPAIRAWPSEHPGPGQRPAEEDRPRSAPEGGQHAWEQARHAQSSARICVEHTNAESQAVAATPALDRDCARTCPRPYSRSAHWSPTGPPPGNTPPAADHASTQGRDAQRLIAHHVVCAGGRHHLRAAQRGPPARGARHRRGGGERGNARPAAHRRPPGRS